MTWPKRSENMIFQGLVPVGNSLVDDSWDFTEENVRIDGIEPQLGDDSKVFLVRKLWWMIQREFNHHSQGFDHEKDLD